jgi:hypothetical protein
MPLPQISSLYMQVELCLNKAGGLLALEVIYHIFHMELEFVHQTTCVTCCRMTSLLAVCSIRFIIQCVPLEGRLGKCWFKKLPEEFNVHLTHYRCVEENGPNYSPL